MPNLSDRLVKLQTDGNYLKKDIANAIGVSVMAYYRYEQGTREPSASVIIALANFFGVSTDYLLGLTDDPRRMLTEDKNV